MRGMRQDAIATKTRLIAAAEKLFAERGIDAVSLNEVQRAAGQKNKSALQYHFGTKERLLEAIIDKHVPGIALRRHAWLDDIEASGRCEVRDLMKALVVPVFEKLDDADGGRAYLAIYAQLIGNPNTSTLWNSAIRTNRGADRLMRMLARSCPELPQAVRMPRYLLVTELLFHSISDYGRLTANDPRLDAPAARDLFLANLIDVLTAIAMASVSPETAALVAGQASGTNPAETPS